ncbi:17021_t:CDS:1, partial [Acaulospora morrowiae]
VWGRDPSTRKISELSIEAYQPIEIYESSDEDDLSDGLGLFD